MSGQPKVHLTGLSTESKCDGGGDGHPTAGGWAITVLPPPDLVLLSDHDACRRILGVDSGRMAQRICETYGIPVKRLGDTKKSPLAVKVDDWRRGTARIPNRGGR